MPIYEYRCAKGHQYERWEGFEAPTEQVCPQCGKPSRRLLSPPAVIFKGSGFYSTDNRSDERASARKDGDRSEDSAAKTEPVKEPAPEKPEASP